LSNHREVANHKRKLVSFGGGFFQRCRHPGTSFGPEYAPGRKQLLQRRLDPPFARFERPQDTIIKTPETRAPLPPEEAAAIHYGLWSSALNCRQQDLDQRHYRREQRDFPNPHNRRNIGKSLSQIRS
jgi:hypothetical protein